MERKVHHFQDLRLWQKAHNFALSIYEHTRNFPTDERYGITNQLRRAGVSIAANIAEGTKRSTTKDLCHFLSISEGSNEEVKCLLLLSRDLGYLSLENFEPLFVAAEVIGSMLNGLRRSLQP